MKPLTFLIAASALLALGFLTGRQTDPEPPEAENSETPTLSTRSARKVIRLQQPDSGGTAVTASPNDLDGLLKLVEPQMAFATSTKLRSALGDLAPSALENLLTGLLKREASEPGYYALRLSLLNHLVAKDPFYALDFLIAQDDQNFKNGSIALVVQAAARINLTSARQALAQINDPGLKNVGNNALLNAPENATSEELLALLQDHPQAAQTHYYHNNFSQWDMPVFGNRWGGMHFSHTSNGSALAKLTQKDLAAAEHYARSLETVGERSTALSQIAAALAQKDPQGALEWARNLDPSEGGSQHLATAISAIATENPQKAAGLLGEIDNHQQKNNAIINIANNWAQKDPQGVIAWLDTLPASQTKMQAYQTAAQQLGSTDPLAAIDLVKKLPGNSRQSVLPNILNQWAAKDFDAAKNWITSQTDPITLNAGLSSFISTWAQRDPAEAASFLSQAPATQNSSSQYSTLASQWANTDRDAALNWAQTIENKDQRANATSGIYQQWANQDPESAAGQLASLSDTTERIQLLHTVASNWINRDPAAARTWMDSLPTEERFTAAGSALSTLSHSQPEEAARLYDQLTLDAANNEEQLRRFNSQASQIANYWGRHDPVAAAEWAENIPGENERSGAYQSVANQWVQYDPTGLSQWIDDLPSGKPRDSATEALVQNIQQVDPASAFDWADTINDQDRRFSYIRGALDQWKRTDPEAAREAANSANVTDKQREQLLNRLQ